MLLEAKILFLENFCKEQKVRIMPNFIDLIFTLLVSSVMYHNTSYHIVLHHIISN